MKRPNVSVVAGVLCAHSISTSRHGREIALHLRDRDGKCFAIACLPLAATDALSAEIANHVEAMVAEAQGCEGRA
ncbi:MAG TPA: hypothetical protein VGA50_04780 [Kiloniellales bacterium]